VSTPSFFPECCGIYVGSTSDYLERTRYHLWALKNSRHHNPRVQERYDRYGDPVFVIIFDVSSRVVRLIEECFVDCWFDNLLNLSKKTNAFFEGRTHTEETKLNLSQLLSGKIESGEFTRFDRTGVKHKSSTKKKISKAMSGVAKSEEHKRKVAESYRMTPARAEQLKKLAASKKGRSLSEETKRKISEKLKGKKKKVSPAMLEHLQRLNASKVGVPRTEEERRKISEGKRRSN